MSNLQVKLLKLRSNAQLPAYQSDQAAGMDIHACLDTPITIQPMERRIIPTGFAIELPVGYEAQVRARSGLSSKHGITMVNGVGTIDADYRGEVGVLLINLGNEAFSIEPDMRIAQLVVAKYETVVWKETDALETTLRGEGGYGSTGLKKH